MDKMENTNLENLTNNDTDEVLEEKKKKKIKIIIIVVACVVVVTLIIVLSVVLTRKTQDPNFYGCMCDAGSSSTRVSVYTWPPRNGNSIPNITEKGRKSTEPGMHTMDEKQIEGAMDVLINYCKDTVKDVSKNTANLSDVSFYLKGTAGMRSLDVDQQNKKLDVIRKKIRESKLKFLKNEWAKVITGKEEGTFGWITANYLNGILFENEKEGKIKKTPHGSIDFGGYSLEITFYTKEEIEQHNVSLKLGNIDYSLYSYSFQDYGQDKFNENLLHSLINNTTKTKNTTVIQHPCYLNGYNMSYIYRGINYTIEGKNDIGKCQEIIQNLMNISTEEKKSMNGTYQPKIPKGTKFYGISGLYWIAYFFDLADKEYHAPYEFFNHTKEFCKKSWEEAKAQYSKKTAPDRLKNYCITGFYVYYFLAKGFKLNENEKLISFPDKINNVEVSWTLGAMSYEIGEQNLKFARYYIKY